jgi:uncharacterized repeat protein (TIGR01451 family)
VTGLAPDGEVEDHLAPVGVEQPSLGVTKALKSVTRQAGTNYVVVFEIDVTNLGNVPLSNVQVTENLTAALAGAASFNAASLTGTGLTVNPGFNGTGDTNLLAAGNTLAVGATGKLTLTLNVNSGGHQGPYTNQVQGSATSPGNATVTSTSDPTPFTLLLNPEEIPTLGVWGLLALALLLGGVAVWQMRRRTAG